MRLRNRLPQRRTVIRADKNGIQVATAEGILNITQLQPARKKPMSAADILNSRKEWFTGKFTVILFHNRHSPRGMPVPLSLYRLPAYRNHNEKQL